MFLNWLRLICLCLISSGRVFQTLVTLMKYERCKVCDLHFLGRNKRVPLLLTQVTDARGKLIPETYLYLSCERWTRWNQSSGHRKLIRELESGGKIGVFRTGREFQRLKSEPVLTRFPTFPSSINGKSPRALAAQIALKSTTNHPKDIRKTLERANEHFHCISVHIRDIAYKFPIHSSYVHH